MFRSSGAAAAAIVISLLSPSSEAGASSTCTVLDAPGATATLIAGTASVDREEIGVGCIGLPHDAMQGPLQWYRGTFALVATIVPGMGAADIEVAVGDGDVILASVAGDGSTLTVSNPTIGETFQPVSATGDGSQPVELRFEIPNYLQQLSLQEQQAPVKLRFTEFGLDVIDVTLERGLIEATDQPPYPIALSLGDVASDGVEVLIELRDPAGFDAAGGFELTASPIDGGEPPTVALDSSQPGSIHARRYRIEPHCDDKRCSVEILAVQGDETVQMRAAITPPADGGFLRPLPLTLILGGTALLGYAAWTWPVKRRSRATRTTEQATAALEVENRQVADATR